MHALDPEAFSLAPTGSALGDMLDAVGAALAAAVRRFGPVPAPWQLAVVITGGASGQGGAAAVRWVRCPHHAGYPVEYRRVRYRGGKPLRLRASFDQQRRVGLVVDPRCSPVLAPPAKRPGQDGAVGSKGRGSRTRVLEDRLWDDVGVEWSRVEKEVSRDRIAALLHRSDVRVGVHRSMKLRWVGEAEKLQVWRLEINPRLQDRPDYRPPVGAPGQKPFVGTLWRSGDRELLLFDDFD